MDLITFTAILLAIITIAYLYLQWSNSQAVSQSARQNLKYVHLQSFFIDAFRGKDPAESKHEVIRREGKLFGCTMLSKFTVVIAEPELIQLVLSKEFTKFTNRRDFKTNDPIISNTLTMAEDNQWKRLRSVVAPTFSVGKLRRMKPHIDDTIKVLLNNIENAANQNDSNVSMKSMFGAYVMDTIIRIAFGLKVDSLADGENQLIKMAKRTLQFHMSLKNFVALLLIMLAPKVAQALNIRLNGEMNDFFAQFGSSVIAQKRTEYDLKKRKRDGAESSKADNFIELMLEAEDENAKEVGGSKAITTDEMIAQCVLFFLGGYETTASTLTLAAYMLAQNPHVQQKAFEEIQMELEKLKESNQDSQSDCNPIDLVTFEAVQQRFPYLSAVINETLRLYAPASMIERKAAEDVTLQAGDGSAKVVIKQGDIVHIPIYSIHRDTDHFPEPEHFNPERFMTDEPRFHRYAYLPFGSGPRNCVAKSLALLEMKFALLHVLRCYKLSIGPETKVPIEFLVHGAFVTPKDCVLRVEKR